jgi:hypothetical protein
VKNRAGIEGCRCSLFGFFLLAFSVLFQVVGLPSRLCVNHLRAVSTSLPQSSKPCAGKGAGEGGGKGRSQAASSTRGLARLYLFFQSVTRSTAASSFRVKASPYRHVSGKTQILRPIFKVRDLAIRLLFSFSPAACRKGTGLYTDHSTNMVETRGRTETVLGQGRRGGSSLSSCVLRDARLSVRYSGVSFRGPALESVSEANVTLLVDFTLRSLRSPRSRLLGLSPILYASGKLKQSLQ